MGQIEAVIFDYGGVLSTPPIAGLAEFEQKMGYPDKALRRLLFGDEWDLLETGKLTLAEFHDRIVDRSEAALGQRLDLSVYAQFLKELGVGVHWMMVQRVRELRAEGFRTAILTNNVKEWSDFWRSSIPIDLFDVVVDSCEVGLAKPDPAIFLLTCERLGVAPEQAVFLDDTRRHVEGARQVGLHGILVDDPWAAIAELDAILQTAAA